MAGAPDAPNALHSVSLSLSRARARSLSLALSLSGFRSNQGLSVWVLFFVRLFFVCARALLALLSICVYWFGCVRVYCCMMM